MNKTENFVEEEPTCVDELLLIMAFSLEFSIM